MFPYTTRSRALHYTLLARYRQAMRAALYLRISQDRTGDAAGVNRQEEDCRQLAADLGWEIGEVFVDNDRSATTGKPRPAFARMLAEIEAGRVGAVVAWHTDRLYRKLADLEQIIPVFESHKVVVRTCRSGELDLATPTGRMLARILGSVASHEGEQKADRWKRSYRQRREAGQVYRSGPRHFGYNRDGTVREDEAETLRWLAAEIMKGARLPTLCRQLDAKGVRTTLGNTWRQPSLRNLLSSPRLAGLVVHDGETLPGVVGDWTPILDRTTWETVRAAIDTKYSKPASARMALLSGLIFCGREGCGKRLYRSYRKGPIYTCKRDPQQSAGHIAVMAEPVERMVEAAARRALDDPRVRRSLAVRLDTAGAGVHVDAMDMIETRIGLLEAELRDAAGTRAAQSLSRAINDLDDQLQKHRDQLAAATTVQLPGRGEEWPTGLERRAALIRVVVAAVWVDPARKRGARFDPSRIRIDPVTAAGA